jgi:hypothetical protein
MLYRVTIVEDVYVGTADEVVAFMARGEGAPGHDVASYMEGVARRLAVDLGIEHVPTGSAEAFLEALAEHGVVRVERIEEPSRDRVDPEAVLGDGPVLLGEGVEPDDV